MTTNTAHRLDLESLSEKAYAITPQAAGHYQECCMVCFHKNGHSSGVHLHVLHNESDSSFEVCWSGSVTERIANAYRDHNKYVDLGACTVALLVVPELTGYGAITPAAAEGTGIDYYLGPEEDQDDVLIFNHKARLEISGILTETATNTVKKRIQAKKRRLMGYEQGGLTDPTQVFIVVVEFGQPVAEMAER